MTALVQQVRTVVSHIRDLAYKTTDRELRNRLMRAAALLEGVEVEVAPLCADAADAQVTQEPERES
jgi:transcriptional regulator of aromatic amino acid metabolism